MFAVIREGEFVGAISLFQHTKSLAVFDLNFGFFPKTIKSLIKLWSRLVFL